MKTAWHQQYRSLITKGIKNPILASGSWSTSENCYPNCVTTDLNTS
jgi:hypothetical protein